MLSHENIKIYVDKPKRHSLAGNYSVNILCYLRLGYFKYKMQTKLSNKLLILCSLKNPLIVTIVTIQVLQKFKAKFVNRLLFHLHF